jgi:hypothetical protein
MSRQGWGALRHRHMSNWLFCDLRFAERFRLEARVPPSPHAHARPDIGDEHVKSDLSTHARARCKEDDAPCAGKYRRERSGQYGQ